MKCAGSPSNGEFTLCGDAFDLIAFGESDANNHAVSGEVIDCPQCRIIIDYCKSIKKGYREP